MEKLDFIQIVLKRLDIHIKNFLHSSLVPHIKLTQKGSYAGKAFDKTQMSIYDQNSVKWVYRKWTST